MLPSYRNQSVDLKSEATDWFLYDGNIGRSAFWITLEIVLLSVKWQDVCNPKKLFDFKLDNFLIILLKFWNEKIIVGIFYNTVSYSLQPYSIIYSTMFIKFSEKILWQIDLTIEYFGNYLRLLYGFWKDDSAQHTLLKLLNAWQEGRQSSWICLELIIVCLEKFKASGVDKTGLNLIHNCLSNRKQTKTNNISHSNLYDIVMIVP